MSLRIAFMATPDFSVPILKALVDAGHDVVAVYSQPPRQAGRRGLELTPSPISRMAESLGIAVYTPKSLKSEEEQQKFQALKLDVAVVVAYGLLLPKAILDAPRLGCYNGHASLLPRWRGAAPIQRAIMAGDAETGMMIMKMDEGLDTGPVALTQKIKIDANMTAGALHDALSYMGADLMVKAMTKLEQGNLPLMPQAEDGVTYAAKINKEEARIDWSQPAQHVQKLICALSPFPGAWCEMQIGEKRERVKILEAKLVETDLAKINTKEIGLIDNKALTITCGAGAIQITKLQKSGGKPLEYADFTRGFDVRAVF